MSQDSIVETVDPGGFFYSNPNSSKSKKPEQPDYIGASKIQAGGSIGTAEANAMMSHNNVNSPLGSQTWNQVGSSTINIPGLGDVTIPQWQQNINLSPEQQALYQGQTALQGGLMQQFGDNMSNPANLQDQAYAAQTSRLDPQWQHNEEMQKTQLANQGLVPGGEAYDNAMRDFNNAKNDAYTQARMAAINTIPTEMALRDMPLNELNAIRSGSPVSMPQFMQGQQGTAQGPNTLAATAQQGQWQQAMYNAMIQQQNAQTQGAVGLGVGLMGLL